MKLNSLLAYIFVTTYLLGIHDMLTAAVFTVDR